MHRSALLPLLLVALIPSLVTAQPALNLGNNAVVFNGASPDGDVAFFSVAKIPLGYSQRVEVRREVVVADATGRAEWALESEPALKSVWAAVDLASGEWALASPEGGLLRQQPLELTAFERDPGGELSTLLYDGHVVAEALVVRTALSAGSPGVWGLRLSDGGDADGDGDHNDAIRLHPASLAAIGEAGAPPLAFAPGDVVVLVDPDRLEVSAVRLEEATAGQGGER